jgi:octaprenyl-diphosphate synthase
MIRPTLVILAGLASQPNSAARVTQQSISQEHITVAAVCEMVHLATLVHDDVLDDADTRRKSETINHLVGNEAAVMLGDFIFSAAYDLCATLDDSNTSSRIARTGMVLCEGELLQLTHRGNFSLDQANYYELIKRKTASLIAVSALLGAKHAGADSATMTLFETYGHKLGIAFQIQDDLLDVTGDQRVVGKPLGKDLANGKLTLPVIHHLTSATASQRGEMLRVLDYSNENRHTPRERLIELLGSTDSLAFARQAAEKLVDDALVCLSRLPESAAKQMLTLLAKAVTARAS